MFIFVGLLRWQHPISILNWKLSDLCKLEFDFVGNSNFHELAFIYFLYQYFFVLFYQQDCCFSAILKGKKIIPQNFSYQSWIFG